jgi:phosphohistidine phosphatase SixA
MLRLVLLLSTFSTALGVHAAPDQVIVVRHAERAAGASADPSITPRGIERAELLAKILAAANVQTIITTDFRRTQETAEPLATKIGITPINIAMKRGELQAHVDAVVDRARREAGVVLVIGHSNTVASIVEKFSSSRPTRLCETSYSNIFIVTPAAPFLPAVQLKYGEPDTAPTPDCQ